MKKFIEVFNTSIKLFLSGVGIFEAREISSGVGISGAG